MKRMMKLQSAGEKRVCDRVQNAVQVASATVHLPQLFSPMKA